MSLSNREILDELIKKQLKNVQKNKLAYDDIKRLSKYIKSSIFDENTCSLWNGYITNSKKGSYVNFYYKSKKVSLHRLLYLNYVSDLSDDEYLKFSCENKGKCCNIKHLNKFKYNIPDDKKEKKKIQETPRKEVSFTLDFN